MLEDPTMDHKKNSRANPAGLASASSEQRINIKQDVSLNTKSGRPPRFPDPGNHRRTGGQDYKDLETRGNVRRGQVKRPSAKTSGKNNCPINFDESLPQSMTKADEFEVGSIFNQGSKKQSLNHLLNFNYTSRHSVSSPRGRGDYRSFRAHTDATKRRPKYKKEQYLQANCQFIVKEAANYDAHLSDPDMIVDWDLIKQVNLKTTSDVPSCPICLYPPTAAKISRCGHVFCWSCILHYLSLSDSSWRKCPICDESIQRSDLKSVVSTAWKEFRVGDEIEFYLMRRERNSLFALPVDAYFSGVDDKHPNLGMRLNYSRIITASPEQVAQHIIARERQELENQYRADQNEPEVCFIEEALQYITEQEQDLLLASSLADDQPEIVARGMDWIKEMEGESNQTPTDIFNSYEEFDAKEDYYDPRPRHTSSSSDGTVIERSGSPSEITADDLEFSPTEDLPCGFKEKNTTPKSTFYFYQSSDGQQIFLHAVNIQMLSSQYGSLENCPRVIRGRILEKESTSMTLELRNKLRYLKHLPVTSIFEVCEIDIRVPKIAREVWEEFQPQLEARQRRRQRRAREEKRRDKKIQSELDKNLLGKIPDPKLRIESNFHFPEMAAQVVEDRSLNQEVSLSACWGGNPSAKPVSFAKMLREGAPSRVTTTRPVHVSQTKSRSLHAEDIDEVEPEGYVPPPQTATIGDMLAQALEKSTLQDPDTNHGGQKKKGKKMKGKMVSLTGGGGRMSLS